MQPSSDFSRLIEIMAALRHPVTGCPWDLEQDFATIRHYTIEEAYEVADAIERQDYADLRDELGDLLLQPVYHARLAEELGLFTIADVIEAITEKLIRRHPHVFGDAETPGRQAAHARWEQSKADERARRASVAGGDATAHLLDGVPRALPALSRADKLAKRAARVGFDWPDAAGAADKVREELAEVETAETTGDPQQTAEEIGDLLFAAASLARKLGIDPEAALTDANRKFERRFRAVEEALAATGIAVENAGFERLERAWNAVRDTEKNESKTT